MANFSQSSSFTGLQTYTLTIPSTDIYNFQGTLATPTAQSPAVSQGPGGGAGTGSGGGPRIPSQVVVTIRKNGSIVYTSAAGDRGFALNALSCAANDSITFALTSSLASDQALNAVQMTLAVSEGPL